MISDKYNIAKFLYNINSLRNLPSIFRHGILSKNDLLKLGIKPIDLSNADVQSRRDNVTIPNYGYLHDYANLYFNPRNPMMFYLLNHNKLDDLCIICVSKSVLDLSDTIVTDRNAAAASVVFLPPRLGYSQINFEKVFATFWYSPDPIEHNNNKLIECAEVLVLNCVPVEYIECIYVCTKDAKDMLDCLNFGVDIILKKEPFFNWKE